jgi:Tfp pilus assembly protein PilX
MHIKDIDPGTRNTRNKGAALPVSLIFLMVLTVIGVSSLGTSVFEEKMAANSLNRELAFQAAEAALREGERQIEAAGDIYLRVFFNGGANDNDKTVNNDGDGCINGYCTPTHHDQAYDPAAKPGDSNYLYDRWLEYDTATDPNNLRVWTTPGRHIEYSNYSALGLAAPPKYIVEFVGHWIPDTGSFCDGADVDFLPGDVVAEDAIWPYCESDPGMYRITALAEASAGARVMLQSTYRK